MSRARAARVAVCVAALLTALPRALGAQPAAADSLRLGALQRDAVARDPRARQDALLTGQTALRLRTLRAERLPALAVNGSAQYQSDVAAIPLRLPDGTAPLGPTKDSYDAHVAARQRLYDPSRDARRDVERAQLAEGQARLRATLFALRQSVSDAYFAALRQQAEGEELAAAVTDLEAQRRVAERRVARGAALPSEVAALEAELLRRRQALDALAANRGAALTVLGDLAGRPVAERPLAIPDLATDVARARAALAGLRARPEYERFARSRELVDRQRAAAAAQERPRLSAFARAGYGRPGLNPLGRTVDEYWLGGVQVEWTPWTWGATRREREVLALQRQIVATEEAAFTESVRRGVAGDLATIDRLERALATDDAIVALRERILREARLRFGEGVVTSAEYVDRETDVLTARLARATHRVELAQARARFLTLVGLEIR